MNKIKKLEINNKIITKFVLIFYYNNIYVNCLLFRNMKY